MWFWWFILVCDCLTPIIMLLAGGMMLKHHPRQINGVLGYRTRRSMQNMDTWRFAHEHAGKLWCRTGAVLLPLTVLIHLPFYETGEDQIGLLSLAVISLQLIILILSVFSTERALKKHFTEDGVRR